MPRCGGIARRSTAQDMLETRAAGARLHIVAIGRREAGKAACVLHSAARVRCTRDGPGGWRLVSSWGDGRPRVAHAIGRDGPGASDRGPCILCEEVAGDGRSEDPEGRGVLLLEVDRLALPGDRPAAPDLHARSVACGLLGCELGLTRRRDRGLSVRGHDALGHPLRVLHAPAPFLRLLLPLGRGLAGVLLGLRGCRAAGVPRRRRRHRRAARARVAGAC
mmetsp:Transcript_2531/g.7263  ORF Transcript_2531/g.7263 Transcript_2531/m.7263 type:complete len:220 (+) Transcript_2531:1226-1885(+)